MIDLSKYKIEMLFLSAACFLFGVAAISNEEMPGFFFTMDLGTYHDYIGWGMIGIAIVIQYVNFWNMGKKKKQKKKAQETRAGKRRED